MTKAFEGAKRKGREAKQAGLPITSCPYPDKRGGRYNHVVTFSRTFRKMWLEGYNEVVDNNQSNGGS